MEWLGYALTNIFLPMNLLVLLAGVAGGILVGALPGLTGTMAIALLVPFTYGLPPEAALIMLGGVYVGAMYGGSIAAILINTPGAPASIATTLDGHPMAQKGKAEEALAISATSSGVGGILGTVVLLLFSPLLATVSLQFGPPEYFWLGVLGLTIIAGLSAKSLPKGLMGGLFGVLISTIGLSPSTGASRLTFDVSDLLGGVEIIVALIGLFCIPQIMTMAETRGGSLGMANFTPKPGVSVASMFLVFKRWGNILRSSVIGVIVGIIPGAGGNVAGLLSYQEAVRAAKDKEQFGHGAVDGVIASETANNAEVEGSLIPLLTLGIPGAPQAAVLFGALLLQGLRPGPELFRGHGAEITYTFILSLFLANIVMFLMAFFGSRIYARALNLPQHLLMPVVLALSVVGSFAGRSSSLDVVIMLLLGLLAYGGLKVAMAPAPIALGVILGPIIERGLVESMMLSQATGSLLELFFTRPISLILIVLTVASAGWPIYTNLRDKRRAKTAEAKSTAPGARKPPPAGARVQSTSNLWIGCVALVFAGVTWWELQGVDLQSSILPLVCAALMALVAVGLLIKAWQLRASPKVEKVKAASLDSRRVLLAALLAVAYVLLLPVIGFYVMTFVVFCLLALMLAPKPAGLRKLPVIMLTGGLACLAFFLVFQKVFNVPFPEGLMF
ncbi:MAG: tripartite tricarboxylate transporter permease [Deltaproteobacteria bacterium]|nr:tripartite tricarboxylate transporter permease [Deltaproteobacteria bacterium]